MQEDKLTGKRYIALLRCSSAGQADTSVDEQLRLIQQYADPQGMIHVDTMQLAGLTGSVPGLRQDIEQLVQRKKERDDYDILLVQDSSRFTRSGPAHGLHIEFQLRAVGVQVVFVKDHLPAGDMGDVMRTMQYYAAKEQSKAIAYTVTRGLAASLREGRSAHCKAPPYGIDRLYCDENDAPKHILRNLADGTQERLDPNTKEVIERFGRNPKSGVPAHYLKQKHERIVLVPGDPEKVAVVRDIFHRHHAQGWGYYRIARELNDCGVPSPSNGLWYVATVRSLLMNPIYRGVGLANVATSAIYYTRGLEGPIDTNLETKDLAHRRPSRRVRPLSDWFRREEPHLKGLLEDAVLPAATAKQEARLAALACGPSGRGNRDRHRDSDFILKDLLTAKQGGYPMTGRRTGPKGRKRAYYAVGRAYSAPSAGPVLRTMIPAEPLHQAVLTGLQRLLSDSDQVRRIATEAALQAAESAADHAGDLQHLLDEKVAIERKLTLVIDELDDLGRTAVAGKVQQLQSRLHAVTAEIMARQPKPARTESPEALAEQLCRRLASLSEQLPTLSATALRGVLAQFISRLVVDLETREVEVAFTIPEWADVDAPEMCLVNNPVYKTDNQAQRIPALKLLLCYHHGQYSRCRRSRAA